MFFRGNFFSSSSSCHTFSSTHAGPFDWNLNLRQRACSSALSRPSPSGSARGVFTQGSALLIKNRAFQDEGNRTTSVGSASEMKRDRSQVCQGGNTRRRPPVHSFQSESSRLREFKKKP